MHPAGHNPVWWLHAFMLAWLAFFQTLWITLQLEYQLSFHWYGVLLPLYVYLGFVWFSLLLLLVVRTDDRRESSALMALLRRYLDYNDHMCVDETVMPVSAGRPGNGNSSSSMHGMCKNERHRMEHETQSHYIVRRVLTWDVLFLTALYTAFTVITIMLVIRLENPTSSFPWWVFWLVATVFSGICGVVSLVGMFWGPLRHWYTAAVRSGRLTYDRQHHNAGDRGEQDGGAEDDLEPMEGLHMAHASYIPNPGAFGGA